MTDCVDADVMIYGAAPDHPFGPAIRQHLRDNACAGSVLLLAEVLGKPVRDGNTDEVRDLAGLLGQVQLRPVDRATAELAIAMAARYRLRAADAVHLASAVEAGADRFVTNNKRDFHKSISEIDVVYPDDLLSR